MMHSTTVGSLLQYNNTITYCGGCGCDTQALLPQNQPETYIIVWQYTVTQTLLYLNM